MTINLNRLLCGMVFLCLCHDHVNAQVSHTRPRPEIVFQVGHNKEVSSVAVSPNGKWLATGSEDCTVKLWNIPSGLLYATFVGHSGSISRLCFDPKSRWLASGGSDNAVKIWDLTTHKLKADLVGHVEPIYGLTVSPDGRFLATSGASRFKGGSIRLWNTYNWTLRREWEIGGQIEALSLSPDRRHLAACQGATLTVFDITSGKETFSVGVRGYGGIQDVAYSPNGAQIVVSMDERHGVLEPTFARINVKTREVKRKILPKEEDNDFVAFLSDGVTAAIGTGNGRLFLWNVRSGKSKVVNARLSKRQISLFPVKGGGIYAVCFGDRSRGNDSKFDRGAVEVWDYISRRRLLVTPSGRKQSMETPSEFSDNEVMSLTFLPTGRGLVSGHNSGELINWLLPNITVKNTASVKRSVRSVSVSPDAKTYVSTQSGGSHLDIWWSETLTKIVKTDINNDSASTASFLHNKNVLAIGKFDGNVRTFNVATGKPIMTFSKATKLDDNRDWLVAFSPDDQILITAGLFPYLRFWDVNSGKLVRNASLKLVAGTHCVDYSSDGRMVACGGFQDIGRSDNGGAVEILNAITGKTMFAIKTKARLIKSIVFSKDNKCLIAAGQGTNIGIWRTSDGKFLRSLEGHTAEVNSISLSPNGRVLASAGADNTIRFWGIESGKLLATVYMLRNSRTQNSKTEWVAFTPDGYYSGSANCEKFFTLRQNGKSLSANEYQHLFNRPDIVTKTLEEAH